MSTPGGHRHASSTWRREGRGGVVCLVVGGDLDLASAPALDAVLWEVDASGAVSQVDLAAVTFADSFGLLPLVESTRRRRTAGGDLVVVAAGPAVRRIFGLMGVALQPSIDVDAWDAAVGGGWPGGRRPPRRLPRHRRAGTLEAGDESRHALLFASPEPS